MKRRLATLCMGILLGTGMNAAMAEENALVIPDPVATVNGAAITKAEFEDFITYKLGADLSLIQNKEQVNQLVDGLAATKIIYERALDKVKNDEAFAKEYDIIKKRLEMQVSDELVASFIIDYSENIKLTDEELKAEYDRQLPVLQNVEYKAAHILVKDQAEAESILKDINAGKITFADAAEKFSMDPGASANGGDLGWFGHGMMVENFTKALTEMEVGTISKAPVQTEFGYHLISLEDKRTGSAEEIPSFEDLRESLEQLVLQDKIYQYIKEIEESAKIEYHVK